VRTDGLHAVGQVEVAAQVPGGTAHEVDHQVMDVLQFIARYIFNSGARVLPGQTMAYGWTLLRFRQDRPTVLEIDELDDPLADVGEPQWMIGLSLAIGLRHAGDDVMRRNHLSGTAQFSNRGHTAIVCAHVIAMDAGSRPLVMQRDAPASPENSGWTILCTQADAVHDETTLALHHLAHLAHRWPFIVPYICLPPGAMVAFRDAEVVVWKVGEEQGAPDPGEPYGWTPTPAF
jgi:hypothetical protein